MLFGALLPDRWESSSNVSTNNRSFPSSKNPHFGNEAKCKTFLVSFAREETTPYISVVREMGISPQLSQDFNSTQNDNNLTKTQKVQDFNSNKKHSKIPDYAKDYKNEYLFIKGIDGCFKYFVDNFDLIFEDYSLFTKKFECLKKSLRKLEYDQLDYDLNTECRLFDKNEIHYGYDFFKKINKFIEERMIDNINQDEDNLKNMYLKFILDLKKYKNILEDFIVYIVYLKIINLIRLIVIVIVMNNYLYSIKPLVLYQTLI